MSENIIVVDTNHSAQEIRNVSMEKKTTLEITAFTGADLFEGRFVTNTTTGHINTYLGGIWVELANATDLNKFGSLIGPFDASGGVTPDGITATQIGSGVDAIGVSLATTASLQKGDFWTVSIAGTIVGIEGVDTLSIGDLLMCKVDGSTTTSDWIGIQMNITTASPRFHITDTALVASGLVTAGSPTTVEVQTLITTQAKESLTAYYTGDDLPTSTPTYVYVVDSEGTATLVEKPAVAGGKYSADLVYVAGIALTVTHGLNDFDPASITFKTATGVIIEPDTIDNFTANTVDVTFSIGGTNKTIIKI